MNELYKAEIYHLCYMLKIIIDIDFIVFLTYWTLLGEPLTETTRPGQTR